MVVQLAMLALFNRWTGGHLLYASAAAVELTLLHNFVWHLHYTWRDRRRAAAVLGQLVRFHISNGLVSLIGNLVLMRILVGRAGFPLLASNGVAILCCSVVNFKFCNYWAFTAGACANTAGGVNSQSECRKSKLTFAASSEVIPTIGGSCSEK